MGLDPNFTPEQIARIEADAGNADHAGTQDPGAIGTAPEGQDPENNESNGKRKCRDVLKSEAWQYFTQGVIKKDGMYPAKCKYCGKIYPMGKSRNTGSLKHHFTKGCKKMPRTKRDKLQKMLQSGLQVGQNQVAVWDFDQDICRRNLAVMVIVHEYPFNIVHHHYLKVFLMSLQPKFKMVTRNTLRSDCIGIYEGERQILYAELEKLDCKMSFSSDLWTSNSGERGFMALTCHYIDDSWIIRKRIINFAPLPAPHTGRVIVDAFFTMLVEWNLDKKAFSLVLDNASSNDACIKEILNGPMKETLPADGSVFHQRCGCHILNLVVQDGLSVLSDEIAKIRDTMKYLRHSQARMERFRLATSQARVSYLKSKWDVATHWNSTYLMLERALKLRPAIDRYAAPDNIYTLKPSEMEWDALQALKECLQIYYTATKKFSGTKYPTLNFYFPDFCEVYINIKKMESSDYPFIVLMGKKMFVKWEKYWTVGNTLLSIACVLDPRCKCAVVEYYFKMLYPTNYEWYMTNLNVCIKALFEDYKLAYSRSLESQDGSGTGTSSMPQSQRASSSGTANVDVNDIRAGLSAFLSGKKTSEPERSELEEYLAEPLDQTGLDVQFDILSWWRLKVPKYPVLSRLIRDILAVPASTVASESTFSTSDRTLSSVRNSLNDESIQALICAQDWLRAPVAEHGGEVGPPLWASAEAEAASDETICGSEEA